MHQYARAFLGDRSTNKPASLGFLKSRFTSVGISASRNFKQQPIEPAFSPSNFILFFYKTIFIIFWILFSIISININEIKFFHQILHNLCVRIEIKRLLPKKFLINFLYKTLSIYSTIESSRIEVWVRTRLIRITLLPLAVSPNEEK